MKSLLHIMGVSVLGLGLALPAGAMPIRELGLLPEPSGSLMGWESGGKMIQLPPEGELVVEKVRPANCRVGLGYSHAPIDGRVDSWGYNGVVNEYNDSQGYSIGKWDNNPSYEHLDAPVARITLADKKGFNFMYVRGGFVGSIYRDADAPDGPGHGKLLAELGETDVSQSPRGIAHYKFWRLSFPKAVDTDRVGFIRKFNMLADVEFLRVGPAAAVKAFTGSMDYSIGDPVEDVTTLGPDFTRLPCKKPEYQHPSAFERRFFRPMDRTAYLLKPAGEGRVVELQGEVSSDASGQVHFLTPPLAAGTAVGAVRVDLGLEGGNEDNYVMIVAQDPLVGSQELLHFDARVGKARRIMALLEIPDQVMGEGRRFWITFSSRQGGKLTADSRISLLTVAPEAARAEYLADRLLMLRGYFAVMSEARPWSQQSKPWGTKWLSEYDGSRWALQRVRPQLMDLYTTVEHLYALAPDDPIISGQYYAWLVRDSKKPFKEEAPAMAAIPGVPRWAQLLDRAAAGCRGIAEWWYTQHACPNGELGGQLADDTKLPQYAVVPMLMDSEEFAPLARSQAVKTAAIALKYNLRDGVGRVTTDALHAYEEGTNHMSIMPLYFYGDPRYIEWLMTAIKTVDKWMYRAPDGKLLFRVNDFGWRQADDPPREIAQKVDHNCDLMLHPCVMLAWYNHNPAAVQRLVDYSLSMPDTGAERGYGGGSSIHIAAYWITGDPRHLFLPKKTEKGDYGDVWQWFKRQPDAAVHGKEAREQPWWPEYVRKVENDAYAGQWSWAVKQRRDVLVKSLLNVLYAGPEAAGVARFRYMWTEAELFTDRIFIPSERVGEPMLGGYTQRNKLWPAYAVSYEKLGEDFAALVLEQGKDRLKVEMINLRETPREGAFRVWQLDHGRYDLKVGPDPKDDGVMGAVESTKTLELARMDAVPVSLPPRKLMIYELKQVEKLDDLFARADLAMSEDDVKVEGGQVKATVHNIGAAASGAFDVALVDALGKTLKIVTAGSLNAPLDLAPKTLSVTLLMQPGAAAVMIDPAGKIAEITRVNNSVPLPK